MDDDDDANDVLTISTIGGVMYETVAHYGVQRARNSTSERLGETNPPPWQH
ncbi:hypothetical protein [Bacillus sp. 165]|uniref:hypothetical protein n=1 Tax=Bacillus sp. 165 TaxID=1529117 RepID=UPI0032AF8978